MTVELRALGDPIEVPLLNHQNVAENASAYCRKTWTQISVALNCSSMYHTDIFCLLFWMKKRPHLGQIKSYYMMPASSSILVTMLKTQIEFFHPGNTRFCGGKCLVSPQHAAILVWRVMQARPLKMRIVRSRENRFQPAAMRQKMVKRW